MSRLAPLDEALDALDLCLYAHGPACCCTSCTACRQARALLPKLDHLVTVLRQWSREVDGEHDIVTAEDLALLLRVLRE